MQVVEKVDSSGKKMFELSGVIDENVDFNQAISSAGLTEFGVDLFEIKRINSVGVKRWIVYFEGLRAASIKVTFHRVSPAIVAQLVSISNFKAGAEIHSVVLPYHCTACNESVFFVKTKEELVGVDLEKTNWSCSNCGKSELEFDDVASDYLTFWRS